ncbi:MAG: YfhO family protein [Bryobacteraceae bacterium]|nr:YfhO family protein [Bryobacteraceae bacterium]
MRSTLAGPALLIAIVVLFFWKLVLTNQYTWLEQPDLSNLVLPWLQFQASEWNAGRWFPLWDPHSWLGQPLIGQAQPGAAYPFNWLLFLVPLNPNGWIRQNALHWYFVLIRVGAALAAYALARSMGRSRWAAIFAGVAYGLAGYVAAVDAPQMVNGAVWTPLVFLFLFRAVRGPGGVRSAVLSGFFLGFGWLAGHHQMNLFVSLAVGLLWTYLVFRGGRPDWKLARLAAICAVVAIAASALQTLPTAEYGRLAVRWSGAEEPLRFNEKVPYFVHGQFALKPSELLGLILPGVARGLDPFVGCLLLSLAILGAAAAFDEERIRWLIAAGLAGLAFSLGPSTPLHGWIYALVPMVEKARVPAAAILLFHLAAAACAAAGIDSLRGGRLTALPSKILAATGASMLLLSLVLFAARIDPQISDGRLTLTAILLLASAAVLDAWRRARIPPAIALSGLLLLTLTELYNSTGFTHPHVSDAQHSLYLKKMAQHGDVISFLRFQGSPRVAYSGDDIPYNIGDWWGIDTLGAYTASVPENMWRSPLFHPSGHIMMGVRYYIGSKPSRDNQQLVFESKSGLKVYENPGAFPRAWAVHQVEVSGNPGRLVDPAFDAGRTAMITADAPSLESCAGDTVDVLERQPERVRIHAGMRCRGLVILSDNYFPGWRATVDGRDVPILEVNGALRGVVVDAGEHQVEFRYQPASVRIGAILTLLAVLLATACLLPGPRGRNAG